MTKLQFAVTSLLMITLLFATSWHLLNLTFETSMALDPLKVNSLTYNDADEYLSQWDSFLNARAPFRYRITSTALAKVINVVLNSRPEYAYLVLNALCFIVTGVGFTAYLMRWYGWTYSLALLGGILAVTTVSLQSTLLLSLADPLSYVAALVCFWSIQKRSILGFIIASIFAVTTKEIFVVVAVLWFMQLDGCSLARRILPALVPIVAFVAIRLILGGAPIEVGYGFNAVAGQFPLDYINRLFHFQTLIDLFVRTFLAFGVIWIGATMISNRERRLAIVYIALVLLATYVLSSRVTRVLGILYPVLVPGFILYIQRISVRRT